jgi:hypothetical protein
MKKLVFAVLILNLVIACYGILTARRALPDPHSDFREAQEAISEMLASNPDRLSQIPIRRIQSLIESARVRNDIVVQEYKSYEPFFVLTLFNIVVFFAVLLWPRSRKPIQPPPIPNAANSTLPNQ